MTLLDVGVWLAAVWARHTSHSQVRLWFDAQDGQLVFCRVTQMSLLRLLSNPAIMRDDVLTRTAAWAVVDRLLMDERVVLADEPQHLEPTWRAFSNRDDVSHKLWTDDYLAAFAQALNMSLTTLDRALSTRYPSLQVELIST